MDNKVWQEFYCNDCDGYIRVKLNMALNIAIEVVCPNCERKHPRSIRNGLIYEGGNDSSKEEIMVPKSAYSKESLHAKMRKHARDAIAFEKEGDISKRHPAADAILKERWFEIFGGR